MIPVRTITRKRDGEKLTKDEIFEFIQGFSAGAVADYQMSAFAMAVYLRGLDAEETAALTDALLHSGSILEWHDESFPIVDKHSTGGVGDKVSLVLAPLLACCDVRVPMLSGRGLGATGGTLDKLESIPGFRTDLSLDELQHITREVGCVITGASAELAPADRRLYALRDVTGTVSSIPLITASIMSKKLAENPRALVLDVKYGSGAFMKSLENASELARSLVTTGRRAGVRTTALVTNMNQPLGRTVGNTVELEEALDVLRGGGPKDVLEVTLALGAELLIAVDHAESSTAAEDELLGHLVSGRAFERFARMVNAQGGNLKPLRPVAPAFEVHADSAGFVHSINTQAIGETVIDLGGGRKQIADKIDHSVGLELLVRSGQNVKTGEPLVRVFGSKTSGAVRKLREAITIGDTRPKMSSLIADRIA